MIAPIALPVLGTPAGARYCGRGLRKAAMDLFQWERVALMLIAIFAGVIVAEIVVTYIRKKII